jgi:putative ABC transport system permease protein
MAGSVQDLRHAVRMLAKAPALTAAGVFTLVPGIGATTTIFSFIHGVLLKPLPYRDPDRIVLLFETSERAKKAFGVNQIPVSPAMGLEWKTRAHSFQSLGMFRGTQSNLGGGAQPERLRGAWMTAGAFEAMGVQPLAGRVFNAGDERADNDSLVVIGERLWRARLGGDLGVVGQTIRLDDKPLTVIGIMPQSFSFPRGYELAHDTCIFEAPNFWRLLVLQPSDRLNIGNHNTSVIARLKPGVTVEKAQAELASIESAVYEQADAASAQEFGVAVKHYHENLVSQSRNSLLLLGGAVLLVLLIACTNVAGLLMVQAVARGREMALRASLGAAPGRLMRQVLTESALLGLLGCAAGTLLSV